MRGNPVLFYVAIGILATGLIVLFVTDDAGTAFGMNNDDFGRLVALTALITVFGAAAVRRGAFGQAVRHALIWLVIILAVSGLYIFRHDFQSIGTRLQAGLMPGSVVARQTPEGESEVIMQKGIGGHFAAKIEINGMGVNIMVDTGASTIALTYRDAERLGLDPESLTYNQPVSTANGMAMSASVTLDEVAIGPIVRHGVQALVSEEGALSENLLGMNFLGDLSSLEMRRDELILRD